MYVRNHGLLYLRAIPLVPPLRTEVVREWDLVVVGLGQHRANLERLSHI